MPGPYPAFIQPGLPMVWPGSLWPFSLWPGDLIHPPSFSMKPQTQLWWTGGFLPSLPPLPVVSVLCVGGVDWVLESFVEVKCVVT